MKRRQFVKTVSATGLGLAAARSPLLALGGSPGEKLVVAVMGLNGRGTVLARVFAKTPNAEVACVCDVDAQVLAKGVTAVTQAQGKAPKGLGDFRRALDDKGVDALVIAAPDHWHAPATILALSAGKHVYVEKPCGHNPREGELLVEAQRKAKRVVQMGTQRRSSPRAIEAVQAIREGVVGRPYLARAWYANRRQSIGRGNSAAGARARSATTARTKSTSRAGRWASTTPCASRRRAGAITSTTIGSSPIRRRRASSSRDSAPSCGRA